MTTSEPPAEPRIAEDALARFHCWIDNFLRGHERVFLVERSRLRENLAGLIQALTVGLPQYSATPSWMFFRNSLISDLLFTLLFVFSMNFGRSAENRVTGPRFRARRDRHAVGRAARQVEMLSLMLLIRRFEEAPVSSTKAQKIGGFCHLYIGQEAVVAGAIAAVRPDDYIITAYRDHAHALARGTSADACMAELFGKETGCSRGLGGSMHFFNRQTHMYGGHAIVGATFHWLLDWRLPLSTGAKIA